MTLVLSIPKPAGFLSRVRGLMRRAMQAHRKRKTRVLLEELPPHVKQDMGIPPSAAYSPERERLSIVVSHLW